MPRILVVDDNPMNVEVLAKRLKRRGFDVLTADDGLAGVASAERELPDLVLMDLSMPGLNGWDATRHLRQSPATQGMPVIAVTSHAMAGDSEKALAAGCTGFISKPIDYDQLFVLIDQLLVQKGP